MCCEKMNQMESEENLLHVSLLLLLFGSQFTLVRLYPILFYSILVCSILFYSSLVINSVFYKKNTLISFNTTFVLINILMNQYLKNREFLVVTLKQFIFFKGKTTQTVDQCNTHPPPHTYTHTQEKKN